MNSVLASAKENLLDSSAGENINRHVKCLITQCFFWLVKLLVNTEATEAEACYQLMLWCRLCDLREESLWRHPVKKQMKVI